MIDKKSHGQLDQIKALHHHWQRAFCVASSVISGEINLKRMND